MDKVTEWLSFWELKKICGGDANMKTKITINIEGSSAVIEEENAEPIVYPIDEGSLESIAYSVGEAVSDYLQGLS